MPNEKYEKAIEFYSNNNTNLKETANKFHIDNKKLSLILKERNLLRKSGHKKFILNEDYFKNIDNKDKSYWIGFILADGCLTKNNTFKLVLSEKDENHINKFLKCLNSNFPIKKERRNFDGKINSSLVIKRIKFYENLINLGLFERKSTKEKIIKMNYNLYKYFILGIYDGDGWLSFNKNCREFGICSSYEICNFIKEFLLKELNIKTNKIILNNSKNINNLYRVRVTKKNDILKILNYLYEDASCFLDRKKEKFFEFKKFYGFE